MHPDHVDLFAVVRLGRDFDAQSQFGRGPGDLLCLAVAHAQVIISRDLLTICLLLDQLLVVCGDCPAIPNQHHADRIGLFALPDRFGACKQPFIGFGQDPNKSIRAGVGPEVDLDYPLHQAIQAFQAACAHLPHLLLGETLIPLERIRNLLAGRVIGQGINHRAHCLCRIRIRRVFRFCRVVGVIRVIRIVWVIWVIRIIRIAALLHKDDRIPGFVQSQREPYIPAGEFPQVAFRKGSTLHCTCHLSAGFCIFNRKRDRYARLEPAVEQDDASVAQPDSVDQRGAGQEQPAILHPDRITVVARLKRATAEDGSCIRTGNFQCGPLSAGEASRFDQQAAAFGLERTTDRSGMIPTVLDGQAAAFYRDRRKRFVRSRNRPATQLEPIISRGDCEPPLK